MQNFEVTRNKDILHRERWVFSLSVSVGHDHIYLDDYSIEHKDNARQKLWRSDGHFNRLMTRDSTIKDPPLPADIESEARDYFANRVQSLPIVK
jgi:hypothetical protein